jgi:hypothetical protein
MPRTKDLIYINIRRKIFRGNKNNISHFIFLSTCGPLGKLRVSSLRQFEKERRQSVPKPNTQPGTSPDRPIIFGSTMDRSDAIVQFCNITSADPDQAESYLTVLVATFFSND